MREQIAMQKEKIELVEGERRYVLGLRIYGEFTYQILSISYGFFKGKHDTSDHFLSHLPTSRWKV
jgi:hypothetical protein